MAFVSATSKDGLKQGRHAAVVELPRRRTAGQRRGDCYVKGIIWILK